MATVSRDRWDTEDQVFENLAKQIKRQIYLVEIKYLNTIFIMKTRWISHCVGNLEIPLFWFLGD